MANVELPWIQTHTLSGHTGCLLRLSIQPGASKSQIVGLHGAPPRLKIKIAAPPVDGKANEELLSFLKKQLGIPLASLVLVRGQTSKQKDVFCLGANLEVTRRQMLPES